LGIFAENTVGKWKPGYRRDDFGLDLSRFEQLAQARFDKDTMHRPFRTWEQGGYEKGFDGAVCQHES
jgi:hypothetical protein